MIQAHNDSVKAVNFAAKARERFATTKDLKVKREIFMGLTGSHLTLFEKTVHFDSPKYLFTLKKMQEDAPIIAQRVAPAEESVLKSKMEALYASIPSLLRGWESRPA